jgi:hypothetical protein
MIEPRCLIAPELRSTLFPDYFAADRKWFRGGTQHGFMPRLRRRGFRSAGAPSGNRFLNRTSNSAGFGVGGLFWVHPDEER